MPIIFEHKPKAKAAFCCHSGHKEFFGGFLKAGFSPFHGPQVFRGRGRFSRVLPGPRGAPPMLAEPELPFQQAQAPPPRASGGYPPAPRGRVRGGGGRPFPGQKLLRPIHPNGCVYFSPPNASRRSVLPMDGSDHPSIRCAVVSPLQESPSESATACGGGPAPDTYHTYIPERPKFKRMTGPEARPAPPPPTGEGATHGRVFFRGYHFRFGVRNLFPQIILMISFSTLRVPIFYPSKGPSRHIPDFHCHAFVVMSRYFVPNTPAPFSEAG